MCTILEPRETLLAFQAKRIVPGLQKDLKRRLNRIVKNPVLDYEVYELKNTSNQNEGNSVLMKPSTPENCS